MVISDPERDPGRVLIVSATTYDSRKEDVCLLGPGDQPRISHKRCIAYDEARLISLEQLARLRDLGHLALQPAVSAEVLARIRNGISQSMRIKPVYIDLLLEQGVID